MNNPARQPANAPMPFWRVASWLGLTTAILLAVGIAIGNAAFGAYNAQNTVIAVGIITWAASLLGIAPIYAMRATTAQQITTAYFIGMAVRLAASAVAALIAVKAFNLPTEPVLIAMLWYYLPLLFLEVALVARYLWSTDDPSRTTGFAAEVSP